MKHIDLILKKIILSSNEITLSRFSEELGDNNFTFGAMEYTTRNNYVREHCKKRQHRSVIKIDKDNKNTIFKFQINKINIHILGKSKSKTFLLKVKESDPVEIDYNLFMSFRDVQITDIYVSVLKDNENNVLQIYRTDKNIYDKIVNHSKIYDSVILSNSITARDDNDDSQEEQEPIITLK